MPEVQCRELLGEQFTKLLASPAIASASIAEQLERAIIPVQGLAGDREAFSFMAFPWPRLSREERQVAPLLEEAKHRAEFDGMVIDIVTDLFGQVNWFFVYRAPTLYDALIKAHRKVVESGQYMSFWSGN